MIFTKYVIKIYNEVSDMLLRFALFLVLFTSSINPLFAKEVIGSVFLKKQMKGFTSVFEFEGRQNNDSRILGNRHYSFGALIPLKNDWSISASYRLVYIFNDQTKKWTREKRPNIGVQKIFKTDSVNIIVRNLQENRYFNNETESPRNRTMVGLSSNELFFDVRPFASYEIFYDLDERFQSRNRAEIGFNLSKLSDIEYGIYFRHERFKNPNDKTHWNSTDSILLRAVLDF